jgi:acyl-CoA synthetase (AMP-forming)/AMP-acid ligase II
LSRPRSSEFASERWGETPIGFVTLRNGASVDGAALLEWVNARLGKTQRLSELMIVDSLPRSAIGKILKRELRDLHRQPGGPADGDATRRGALLSPTRL